MGMSLSLHSNIVQLKDRLCKALLNFLCCLHSNIVQLKDFN